MTLLRQPKLQYPQGAVHSSCHACMLDSPIALSKSRPHACSGQLRPKQRFVQPASTSRYFLRKINGPLSPPRPSYPLTFPSNYIYSFPLWCTLTCPRCAYSSSGVVVVFFPQEHLPSFLSSFFACSSKLLCPPSFR